MAFQTISAAQKKNRSPPTMVITLKIPITKRMVKSLEIYRILELCILSIFHNLHLYKLTLIGFATETEEQNQKK